MYPRSLNAVVTMDTLEALGHVSADAIEDALYDSGISLPAKTEVINRLYNKKAIEDGITVQAKELARGGILLPKGSKIEFIYLGKTVRGIFNDAFEDEEGSVCINVTGQFRIVTGNREVKIWPKEPQKAPVAREPEFCGVVLATVKQIGTNRSTTLYCEEPKNLCPGHTCGEIIGDHLAYGRLVCDQSKGHVSAHRQSQLPKQCAKIRNGARCALNEGHDKGFDRTPHDVSRKLRGLRNQHPEDETWTEYQAEFIWMNLDRFLDREIQLPALSDDKKVGGKLTDSRHVNIGGQARVFLVFDGKIHVIPPHVKVKVAPLERARCFAMWVGDGDSTQCTLSMGHSGPHIH